jgi:hypothetical protein
MNRSQETRLKKLGAKLEQVLQYYTAIQYSGPIGECGARKEERYTSNLCAGSR